MKYFTTFFSLLALTAAAPAPVPQAPTGANFYTPTVRSQYRVSTGAITYNTGRVYVFKDGYSPDQTTLLTFNLPSTASGRRCRFRIYLDSTAIITGSRKVDLYGSLNPAPGSTTTWGPGNQRNQPWGRLNLAPGTISTPDPHYPISDFNCPTGTAGFELVGVHDRDTLDFTGSISSAYIEVL